MRFNKIRCASIIVVFFLLGVGYWLVTYYMNDPQNIQLNAKLSARDIRIDKFFEDATINTHSYIIFDLINYITMSIYSYIINQVKNYNMTINLGFKNVKIIIENQTDLIKINDRRLLYNNTAKIKIIVTNPIFIFAYHDSNVDFKIDNGNNLLFNNEPYYKSVNFFNVTNSHIYSLPINSTYSAFSLLGGNIKLYDISGNLMYTSNNNFSIISTFYDVDNRPAFIYEGNYDIQINKYNSIIINNINLSNEIYLTYVEGTLSYKNPNINLLRYIKYDLVGSNNILLKGFKGEVLIDSVETQNSIKIQGHSDDIFLDNYEVTRPDFSSDLMWFINNPISLLGLIISIISLIFSYLNKKVRMNDA